MKGKKGTFKLLKKIKDWFNTDLMALRVSFISCSLSFQIPFELNY